MNILFWNTNKKDLSDIVVALANENNIDMLFLAESGIKPHLLLTKLNNVSNRYYFNRIRGCEKIHIYTRYNDRALKIISETSRITARELYSYKLKESISFICLHYQSKVNWDEGDQNAYSSEIQNFIKRVEAKTRHKNTIVFGDFNMHPFQNGMIQSTGLHSTMDANVALKRSRRIEDNIYDYLYNPMWSFLGDNSKGKVSGTLYYSPSKPLNYHWNLFDQVLIRPSLIASFDNSYLDIITKFSNIDLLKNGIIDNAYSDHLPIKFSLKI